MIAFLAKRVSGPALVYAVLALFLSNAVTGYLLKRAYDAKITARLECNNEKLQEALQANEAARAAIEAAERERDEERRRRAEATRLADDNAARRMSALREDHANELELLRAELAAMPAEEIDCATRPVTAGVLDRMRERARSYNEDRSRRGDDRDNPPD